MSEPIGDLSTRMRDIVRLVVEAYLERGQPVGSKMLAGAVNLSPASIRGVMQELEERGLLTHPHTSSGRIPTEHGLRLFVDGIMHNSLPRARERAAIEFAERFAEEPKVLADDEDFWVCAHALFSDGELVDLAHSVAAWVGLGPSHDLLSPGR